MRVCLLSLVLFTAFVLGVDATNILVRPMPHTDLLPTNRVNSIFQDSEGYIWYATQEGLCRDDGYDINIFRSDFRMPDCIKSNDVRCVGEDSVRHRIWLGTAEGLYFLDKDTYSISPCLVKGLQKVVIEDIVATSDHSVWVSTEQRLFKLSADGKPLKIYKINTSLGAGRRFCLYEDRSHRLLLSVSGVGMHLFDKATGRFKLIYPYTDRVSGILQDKDNRYYWLASWDNGVVKFDPSNPDKSKRYVPQPLPVNSVGESARTAIGLVQDDANGYVWVVSWSDLFIYRKTAEGSLKQLVDPPFFPRGKKVLKSIMKDRDGNLWVSASDNHNFIIRFGDDDVYRYDMALLERQMHCTPYFEQMCLDEEGVFWLFQRREGLCLYNPVSTAFSCYKNQSWGDENLFLVLQSMEKSRRKGLVWVVPQNRTTVYGLMRQGMNLSIERTVNLTDITDSPPFINYIFEDRDGHLFVSASSSLYVYDIKRRRLHRMSADFGSVTAMRQTADGTVWAIVNGNQLVAVRHDSRRFHVRSFSQTLSCLAADNERIWLGTDKGEVLLYDYHRSSCENYTKICGMTGDRVNALVADRYGHLWIMTGHYVREFNPRNGAYRTFHATSENTDVNRFLPNSTYEAPDGRIYVCGLPGALAFSPSTHLNDRPKPLSTVISDIRVMGRSILLQTNDRTDRPREQIEISPDEHNIEIHFSSLNFRHASRTRYAYKLEGVDAHWINLPVGKNVAIYNKLVKGNYVFKVKATDDNGLWSDNIAELRIVRLPAWYETWLAYVIYVLLLGAAGYQLYRMVSNRVRMKHALDIAKIEARKMEEVNHAKLQFFTNITHELLTPLSIISASVDEMAQVRHSGEGGQTYKVIKDNTQRLVRLIQQILEFRKVENGKIRLRVSKGNVTRFLRHSVAGFAPLVRKRKLTIHFVPTEDYTGYFDVDKLDKIMYNLISNAAKYTPEGGTITLTQAYDTERERLCIRVNNPGEVIPPDRLSHLFERFYEGEYRKFRTIGNGIGLSLARDLVTLHHGTIRAFSDVDEGNTFVVELPLAREAFTSDEIDDSVDCTDVNVDVMDQPTEESDDRMKVDASVPTDVEKATLLLVEDNEELRASMVNLLHERYHILQAANGVEALAVLETNEVNLIVSDVMMPEMDGMELCARVKEQFETCHIPVILLTAKVSDEDRVTGYQSGADGYICKPLRLSVLLAKIDNLLKRGKRAGIDFRKQLVFEAKDLNYTSMDEEFIHKAIDCVNAHLDDCGFDSARFTADMAMARTTLANKLKQLTGLTPSGFINNVRLQAASRLIDEQKKMRVSDLAYAVGFSDPKYFTLLFRKKFGLSPREYMAKYEA